MNIYNTNNVIFGSKKSTVEFPVTKHSTHTKLGKLKTILGLLLYIFWNESILEVKKI